VRWTLIFILYLILSGTAAFTQQLNGIWKGTLTQNAGGCFEVYHVELQVNIKNNSVYGFCYHFSDLQNYVRKNYDGIYNAATKTISIQENSITTFHVPKDCTPCIRFFTLTYTKEGNQEKLSGDWGGRVFNGSAACTPGRIELARVTRSAFDHIQEIRVDSGILRLDFYDNAEIDGDSITIKLDEKILVSNQRLGLKPISMEIRVSADQPEQELTMIAENLGTIPPNTAMLIVTAGTKKYRLFLSSDKQKSAMVRILYTPGSSL
jgi:hypothetical protein